MIVQVVLFLQNSSAKPARDVVYKAWQSLAVQKALFTNGAADAPWLLFLKMFSTKLGGPKEFVYKRCCWCSMVLKCFLQSLAVQMGLFTNGGAAPWFFFSAAGRASAHTDYLRKRKLRIGGMHYGGNTTVCLLSVIPLNLIPFLNRHIFYTFEQLSAWGIHWTCFKNKEMRSLLIN